MKDLDFDELDRAVSSLMDGVVKTPTATNNSATSQTETKSSDSATESALNASSSFTVAVNNPMKKDVASSFSSNTINDTAATTDQEIARSLRPTERSVASTPPRSMSMRRSGRFMDVHHPSSDMKNQIATSVPSREGISLSPIGRDITSQSQDVDATATSQRASLDNEPASGDDVTVKNNSVVNDWPDPIDASTKESTSAANTQEDSEVAAETAEVSENENLDTLLAQEISNSSTSSDDVISSSPFLPNAGAKLMKRPLGKAESDVSQPDFNNSSGNSTKLDNDTKESALVDSQLPANAQLANELPEELHSDLMAIESGAVSDEPSDIPVKANQTPPSMTMAKPVSSKPSVPTAAISQQYQQQPNTDTDESGSIYDTEQYHQPLTHPAKKSSGWMWIVWIVLILTLGAGGGAVVYLFVL